MNDSCVNQTIVINLSMTIRNNMILFDDIGSYPLPKDIPKTWVADAIKRKDPKFQTCVRDAMRQKIEAGVDTPTYPQFQDMNQQFLDIINDEAFTEEPLIVRNEKARILELDAIEEVGAEITGKMPGN